MLVRTLLFSFILTLPLIAKVSPKVEQMVAPYLLPENHPAKKKLDAIFAKSNVLLNEKTIQQAGFIDPKPRKFTHLIVTTHPKLPGYVIKTYLDSQRYYKRKAEYEHWMARIQGVSQIAGLIEKYGLQAYFKTPKKWIYRVPARSNSKNFQVKNFLLIEEDMDLVSEKQNLALWKSGALSQSQLQGLHLILKKVGLRDCATPDNIPFSRDGRIAFIDTQTHGAKVPFENLSSFLSGPNRSFWKQLIKK